MTYEEALRASRIPEVLKQFGPTIVGTLPLNLAVATSDVDLVCEARDPNAFADVVWDAYRQFEGFQLHRWRDEGRPVVARFVLGNWPFEIFADARPIDQQRAWRHFDVERRLLELDDGRLYATVRRLRAAGCKTEPAFAVALNLVGDPYLAMLELFPQTDEQLRARLAAANSGLTSAGMRYSAASRTSNRQADGGTPTTFLNARLNASSD
jgi:hypothetical protein